MRSIGFLIIILSMSVTPSDFLNEQKKCARVRTALNEKEVVLSQKLGTMGLQLDNFNLLLVAYKQEGELELYVKQNTETTFKKLETYAICSKSGKLGPKRRLGDEQVPEGFYHIDRFNPASKFYLSLGINYPNAADKKKSSASNLGGDIFIHGNCVTIGCLPMTDDKIKEIYLFAVFAKNNGQVKIPVYLFPFKMTDQNFAQYKSKYSDEAPLLSFWENLKSGYDAFRKSKKSLAIRVGADGDYSF